MIDIGAERCELHSPWRCFLWSIVLIAGLTPGLASAQPVPKDAFLPVPQDNQYVPGPDSLPQTGVPKGKLFEFEYNSSRVFPGSARKITVYVPAQYKGDRPASLYVGLDALAFELPTVFDNLIAKGDMPVTIAIGVSSGTVASIADPTNPRFNRSLEFDALGDDLARLLLDEVLPEVTRRKTPDGLPIVLSSDPNDRAVGGASTGAVAAFTLAWRHPEQFRRVFSAIGTYVGMRGGDSYPALVRKTEPKPLRIFLQDGTNDQLDRFIGEVGNWWLGNLTMESALRFAGYDVAHVWGEGGHSFRHATAIFPEAMRWLWRDWPAPIVAGTSENVFFKDILIPGENWTPVGADYSRAVSLAAAPDGSVHIATNDSRSGWMIHASGVPGEDPETHGGVRAFGADGTEYFADDGANAIRVRRADGKTETLASGLRVSHMIATGSGRLYATEDRGDAGGRLWMFSDQGAKYELDTGLVHPSGLALSADGLWLAVAEAGSRWGYSYRVLADGQVDARQRFYWFHVDDDGAESGTGGLAVDHDGRMYAATRIGIQVFDRNGRSRAIMPLPCGSVVDLTFASPSADMLYVSCAVGHIYRRKIKVRGAHPWMPPQTLPPWQAG